jgi:hypothetical protein
MNRSKRRAWEAWVQCVAQSEGHYETALGVPSPVSVLHGVRVRFDRWLAPDAFVARETIGEFVPDPPGLRQLPPHPSPLDVMRTGLAMLPGITAEQAEEAAARMRLAIGVGLDVTIGREGIWLESVPPGDTAVILTPQECQDLATLLLAAARSVP